MNDQTTPPWIKRQAKSLLLQNGHAWLLHGASGLGQYSLALELAKSWLCEQPGEEGACGICPACHAIEVRTHADLFMLMPEETMLDLAWPLGEKAQSELDDKKRKPSKEIRIDAMREAIEFTQRTSSRGRAKVVLIYPAESMNTVTANALLKTLEEPPGDMRFVLASEAVHQLLPTIRSRCMMHGMVWPQPSESMDWLQGHGLGGEDASGLLNAAGNRPEDAYQYFQQGRSANAWSVLPKALMRGDGEPFKNLTALELLDLLQKLSYDLLAKAIGAAPRFFQPDSLPAVSNLAILSDWSRDLMQARRTIEHPFNPGLLQEDFLSRARHVMMRAR